MAAPGLTSSRLGSRWSLVATVSERPGFGRASHGHGPAQPGRRGQGEAQKGACQASPLGFAESQNHRMVGVGSDLCGSPSPTLLPKQGHLQQAVEDLVQADLEYLQRRRLHSLPGQPGPGLRHQCSPGCCSGLRLIPPPGGEFQ